MKVSKPKMIEINEIKSEMLEIFIKIQKKLVIKKLKKYFLIN